MQILTLESTIQPDHVLQLPKDLPIGLTVRVTIEPLPESQHETNNIAQLLKTARQCYLEEGGKLMNQEEILQEARKRRGEAVNE